MKKKTINIPIRRYPFIAGCSRRRNVVVAAVEATEVCRYAGAGIKITGL